MTPARTQRITAVARPSPAPSPFTEFLPTELGEIEKLKDVV